MVVKSRTKSSGNFKVSTAKCQTLLVLLLKFLSEKNYGKKNYSDEKIDMKGDNASSRSYMPRYIYIFLFTWV